MIGLGIMGLAIAEHLVAAGVSITGTDIVAARRRMLSQAGGRAETSVAKVCPHAKVFLLSLPSSAALESVTDELCKGAARGSIVIETSTLPIPDKQTACDRLKAKGIVMLDCPLSGTGSQAKTKDLVVYASGDPSAYRKVAPLFELFAREHHHVGPFGDGMKVKMLANMLVAIHNVAAAEALTLARASGLDVSQVLGLLRTGAGGSRMLDIRGPKMLDADYSPLMRLELWQKDMSIISEFARSQNFPGFLFSASVQLYAAAMAEGHVDADSSVVCKVIESLAGIERRPKPKTSRAKA